MKKKYIKAATFITIGIILGFPIFSLSRQYFNFNTEVLRILPRNSICGENMENLNTYQ
jgi:hypothetical protein